MPMIFFSVAKGKLPIYILPCMAPVSTIDGGLCGGYCKGTVQKSIQGQRTVERAIWSDWHSSAVTGLWAVSQDAVV